MKDILQRELSKYLYAPLLWVLLALWTLILLWAYFDPFAHLRHLVAQLALAPQGIVPLLKRDAQQIAAVVSPGMATNYSLSVWSAIGPHLTAIIGAYLGGSEYSWRTLPAMLTHTRRRDLITVKLVLLTLYILVLVGITLVVGLAAAWYTTWEIRQLYPELIDGVTTLPEKGIFLQIFVAVIGPLIWGVLGFLVAVTTKSTLAGVLAGILYPYFEIVGMGRYLADSAVYNWLPAVAQISLLPAAFVYVEGAGVVGSPMLPRILDIWKALPLTLVYLILLILTSIWAFRSQDA
ncbi:MAG: hypothetical protein H0Z35_06760 [Thermoanaerobacteraceae bacterium]|nr:hypothetical protein [Thermoanaerobacteraceae bacterium]